MDYEYITQDFYKIIKVENTIFVLDSNPETASPEHLTMLGDFEDISKLEYFVSLLMQNPDTAFSVYNNL